jgi:hypothetical protein
MLELEQANICHNLMTSPCQYILQWLVEGVDIGNCEKKRKMVTERRGHSNMGYYIHGEADSRVIEEKTGVIMRE